MFALRLLNGLDLALERVRALVGLVSGACGGPRVEVEHEVEQHRVELWGGYMRVPGSVYARTRAPYEEHRDRRLGVGGMGAGWADSTYFR